jgi:ActR/RegA family two-component response regulator
MSATPSPAGADLAELLVVQPDDARRREWARRLSRTHLRVRTAASSAEALSRFRERCPALTLVDTGTRPGIDTAEGRQELIPALLRQRPGARIVVLRLRGVDRYTLQDLRDGASDWLSWEYPPDVERLETLLDGLRVGPSPGTSPPRPPAFEVSGDHLIGGSAALERLRNRLAPAAGSGCPVLVRGETGTGIPRRSRAAHPRAPGWPPRSGQLRRHLGLAVRVGAVRPRVGQLHGRSTAAHRRAGDGCRRHTPPRRSGRHTMPPPCAPTAPAGSCSEGGSSDSSTWTAR